MLATRGWVLLALGVTITGCGGDQPIAGPEAAGAPSLDAGGVAARVTGSGTHVRIGAEGEELTTFAFSAIRHADGTTSGQWEYHFRVAGFAMHGPVTCLSIAGHEAWVGGTVTKVLSDDPAFQDLLGVEMWWRSRDNGEGSAAPPDSTTGLGFAFPGVTITAESWCRDQPVALVLRQVAAGNIRIEAD
jgi:hypothetical protein